MLALLGSLDRLETFDVVIVDVNDLDGVSLEDSPGETSFTTLSSLHVDAADLDHRTHVMVAGVIAAQIYGDRSQRWTKSRLKELLKSGIEKGTIDASEIREGLRQALDK